MLFHSLHSTLQHYFITHSPILPLVHALLTSVGNKQKENCCSTLHKWPYTVITVHPGDWTVIFDIMPLYVCSFDFIFFPCEFASPGFSIHKGKRDLEVCICLLWYHLFSQICLSFSWSKLSLQNTLWITHGTAPRHNFPNTIFSLSAWHFMGLTTLHQFGFLRHPHKYQSCLSPASFLD